MPLHANSFFVLKTTFWLFHCTKNNKRPYYPHYQDQFFCWEGKNYNFIVPLIYSDNKSKATIKIL